MKKKFSFVAVALSMLMFVGLASCGGNKTEKEENETQPTETEYVDDTISTSTTDMTADNDEAIDNEESSSSEDWDAILDEYENYCTKLASLSKKAMSGDMSAITEYTSMLESAQSLQEKLEKAESDMTAAQVARLNKIVNKMASAMM